MLKWAVFCAAVALWGCDDGGGGDAGDGGLAGDGGVETDGASEGDGGPRNVPYEGDLPPLPDGAEADRQSHFPVPEGGVWRYRKQAADFANPPPVTQGGETELRPGEGENEVVRETTTIIELEVEDEPARVRQTITETLVVTPSRQLVGPKVEFKALRIEEREVESDRFVRVVERRYLPPYVLIEDAWKVGQIFTQIQRSDVRMTETRQLRGMEEPETNSGLIELNVETQPVGGDGAVVPMECQYREGIREIIVFDDFSGTETRRYWLQQGVGPVQWRFRDTNNITFTLTETNLEPPGTACGE